MNNPVFAIDFENIKDSNLLEQVKKHGYRFKDLCYLTVAGNACQYTDFLYEQEFITFIQREKLRAAIQHYVRCNVVKVEEC